MEYVIMHSRNEQTEYNYIVLNEKISLFFLNSKTKRKLKKKRKVKIFSTEPRKMFWLRKSWGHFHFPWAFCCGFLIDGEKKTKKFVFLLLAAFVSKDVTTVLSWLAKFLSLGNRLWTLSRKPRVLTLHPIFILKYYCKVKLDLNQFYLTCDGIYNNCLTCVRYRGSSLE